MASARATFFRTTFTRPRRRLRLFRQRITGDSVFVLLSSLSRLAVYGRKLLLRALSDRTDAERTLAGDEWDRYKKWRVAVGYLDQFVPGGPDHIQIIAQRVIVSEEGKGFLKPWIDEYNPSEDEASDPALWILTPFPISHVRMTNPNPPYVDFTDDEKAKLQEHGIMYADMRNPSIYKPTGLRRTRD
jgi:hypothetical protein